MPSNDKKAKPTKKEVTIKGNAKTITKTSPKDKEAQKSGRIHTAEGWKRKTMAVLGKPRPRKSPSIVS